MYFTHIVLAEPCWIFTFTVSRVVLNLCFRVTKPSMILVGAHSTLVMTQILSGDLMLIMLRSVNK